MEGSHDTNQSPYVVELKEELAKISHDEFVHATRMLTEETKRVESGDKYRNIPLVELHHDRPQSNAVKIRIPAKEYPKVNFSGKLLGPKGSTLKQLQQETGCKLSILGKGSMRDKAKEEELRKEGGKYAHLNEELHLLVECFAETVDAYGRLANAVAKLKDFLNPEADPQALQEMMGAPMEGGFYNGEGLGRGGMGPRGRGLLGAPGGRGGMPPSRGGVGGPPVGRGAPPARGAPMPRGAPAPRGPPAARGIPPPRGMASTRGAPAPSAGLSMRGGTAPAARGVPVSRSAPVGRGSPMAAPASRGRGLAPPVSVASRAPAVATDYDDYGADTGYAQDPLYATETYDDAYGRRDPYAEEPYAEQAAGAGDTQYFDYGHGATGYDEYSAPAPARAPVNSRAPPVSSAYDRSALKAPTQMAAKTRGGYRSHPYDARTGTGGY